MKLLQTAEPCKLQVVTGNWFLKLDIVLPKTCMRNAFNICIQLTLCIWFVK
jgi:hypothetical protein